MGLADIAGKMAGKDAPESSGELDGDQADGPGADGEYRDPPPQRPEGKQERKAPPVTVSAAKRRQIEKEIADFLELLATGWSLRCPVCADALDEAKGDAAKNAATIICRNPRWVTWFEAEGFGTFMTWAGLGMAFKPVAGALWEHRAGGHDHVVHGDGDDGEGLGLYAAPRL